MNRPIRLLAVVPLVVGLGWLSVFSVQAGNAGSRVFDAGLEMYTWSTGRSEPSRESLNSVQDDLVRAQAYIPDNGAIHELLGLIAARRVDRPDYLAEADVHYVRALQLRPTSPYTWANLVSTRYRRGDAGMGFYAAVSHATELGPNEREVQLIIANYGLAVWDEAEPGVQKAIDGMVAAGMRRNPLEMLQIAERRGRLGVPCRHFAGSPRLTDSKWSQLCQSMEATS